TAPTLSPDGTHLACSSDYGESRLIVLTLATGDTATMGTGFNPRWSPDGQWLAYSGRGPGVDHRLMVSRPDGSEPRTLSDEQFMGWIDWSPDSSYLVATSMAEHRISLVRTSDGEVITLPLMGRYFFQAAWRP